MTGPGIISLLRTNSLVSLNLPQPITCNQRITQCSDLWNNALADDKFLSGLKLCIGQSVVNDAQPCLLMTNQSVVLNNDSMAGSLHLLAYA